MDKKNINQMKKQMKKEFLSFLLYSSCSFVGINSFMILSHSKLEKVQEDAARIDPCYRSLTDRGILLLSDNAKEKIDQICQLDIADCYQEFDVKYLNALDITLENARDAYGNFQKVNAPFHIYDQYFDSKTNVIDWDGLAQQIYENSKSYVVGEEDIDALSSAEVLEKVENMEEFYEELKEDFPSFNSDVLACNLEQYSMIEEPVSYAGSSYVALASTSDQLKNITYYDFNGEIDLSEKEIDAIDYHEDFHVFVDSCPDKEFYGHSHKEARHGGGININTSYVLDEENDILDDRYQSRYHYPFLEEIYAELYSKEKMNMKQDAYPCYDEVLDVMQLTLGLNDEYRIDQILADIIYQDPLSFIRNFPVYGKDEKYFVQNLQMLKSFNTALKPDYYYLLSLDLDFDWQFCSVLRNSALHHLTKTFFNNLIVMNEKHFTEITLEDNYHIMHLFCKYLENADHAIQVNAYYLGNIEFFSDDIIDTVYQESRSIFFDYLSEKFQVDRSSILQQYSDFTDDKLDEYSFPSFMPEVKREYYQELIAARNRDIFDDHGITLQKVN